MNRIILGEQHRSNLTEVETWLRDNVGRGSRRYRTGTWMGTDDWFYYEDVPEPDPELDHNDDVQSSMDVAYDMVFVFRREEDSTMFAIKWA